MTDSADYEEWEDYDEDYDSENLEEETEHDDNYYWDDVEEEYKRNPDGEEWRWYGRRYAKSSHDTFTTDQGKDDDIITVINF